MVAAAFIRWISKPGLDEETWSAVARKQRAIKVSITEVLSMVSPRGAAPLRKLRSWAQIKWTRGSAESPAFGGSAAFREPVKKNRGLRTERSLHCKVVKSCFFGKLFRRPPHPALRAALSPMGARAGFPHVCGRKAALRYPLPARRA